SEEIGEPVAPVVPPGSAPRADARLQRDAAIVARAAGDVAPNDPVAPLHGMAQNIGALAVDLFNVAARLMAGDDRQTIAVTQWTMPAMHIRAAEQRSAYEHQHGARVQIRK